MPEEMRNVNYGVIVKSLQNAGKFVKVAEFGQNCGELIGSTHDILRVGGILR